MDPFSYIVVLTSIVLALGVTRMVGGFGHLMQRKKRARPYWVHTLWLVNVLLLTAIVWYISYRWRANERWPFLLFLWLLVQPILLYLISCVLFPDQEDRETVTDWRTYFFDNQRRIFLLLALNFPLDMVDTLLKGTAHFRAQGPIYLGSMILLTCLCVTAALIRNKRFHSIFVVFFLIYSLTLVGVTTLTDQGMIGGSRP